jgi:hypothetical protein
MRCFPVRRQIGLIRAMNGKGSGDVSSRSPAEAYDFSSATLLRVLFTAVSESKPPHRTN